MQAIILAAGMGKRLGDLTAGNTKCMVKVLGKTIIERVLEQLIEVGINKIVIVVGYQAQSLMKFIGHNFRGAEIIYVDNVDYYKTNNIYSLYLAKDYLVADDTILLESDLIFDTAMLKNLVDQKSHNVVTVAKFESWMDGTVVTIDENDQIISFVPKKKFDFSKIEEYYKTVNVYKFSKEFCEKHYIPFLEAYCRSLGDNEYYEEVLRVIAFLEKSDLKAMVVDPTIKWYEIDDVQDLQIAETLFSNNSDKLNKFNKRYGGYWRFPKLKDFCYLINPYFPPENLKNELIYNFQILMEQYPSGQEVNRSIAAKVFEIKPSEVLVGNGAAELINAYLTNETKITGIVLPTFEEYFNRLDKSKIRTFIPDNDTFSYNVDDLIKFSEEVEQLLLINPDNPSGNYIPQSEVFRLAEYLKSKNKTLLLDESFVDFTTEGSKNTLIHSQNFVDYPNLVIIKSISKSYGVPGFRLGVLASGNKEVIEKVKSRISIWNINSFGEFFMQIVDKYQKNYAAGCLRLVEERNFFYNELQKISFLRVIPSQSNYFLCEVKGPFSATELTNKLLCESEIYIKDCSYKIGFGDSQFVRIAIRNRTDNEMLLNVLHSLQS